MEKYEFVPANEISMRLGVGPDIQGVGPTLRGDAWNVEHNHSSYMLHSRDRLVGAISIRLTTVWHPRNRRMLIASKGCVFRQDNCVGESGMWFVSL